MPHGIKSKLCLSRWWTAHCPSPQNDFWRSGSEIYCALSNTALLTCLGEEWRRDTKVNRWKQALKLILVKRIRYLWKAIQKFDFESLPIVILLLISILDLVDRPRIIILTREKSEIDRLSIRKLIKSVPSHLLAQLHHKRSHTSYVSSVRIKIVSCMRHWWLWSYLVSEEDPIKCTNGSGSRDALYV